MFCPNCGNQNPENAPNCVKCGFALKAAAPQKFKGTMMMAEGLGAPPPGPGPGAVGAARPGAPAKLKGTMVGVAPPSMGAAPAPPQLHSPEPPANPLGATFALPDAAAMGVGAPYGGGGGAPGGAPAGAPKMQTQLGGYAVPGADMGYGQPSQAAAPAPWGAPAPADPGAMGGQMPPQGFGAPAPQPEPAFDPGFGQFQQNFAQAEQQQAQQAFGAQPFGGAGGPGMGPDMGMGGPGMGMGGPGMGAPGMGMGMSAPGMGGPGMGMGAPGMGDPNMGGQQGFGGGAPGGGGGGGMVPAGDVNTTLPLVLSVVSLFCCGLGTLLGIGGLVLAIQAKNAQKMGDLATAQQKAKLSTILAAVGIGVGLLGGVVSAVLRS